MKRGLIEGISGHIVFSSRRDVKIGDRVFVGKNNLSGEVVRILKDRSVIMVYEDTRGLRINDDIIFTDVPTSIRVGPGILSKIFDGLQRPLQLLRDKGGDFILPARESFEVLPSERQYFYPQKRAGDIIKKGEAIGYVLEKGFKIFIFSDKEGEIERIKEGDFHLKEPLARLKGGEEIYSYQNWPIKEARPYKKKLIPKEALITGQRMVDFLFPIPIGGTVIFPGGFGTGKTVLQQTIAKFAKTDIVIYIGCGERGNEMAELLEDFGNLTDPWNQKPLMDRTVIVVNTSNMPVAAREASLYTGVALAEFYRDCGLNVLLIADSLSRWAEALREISSSLEEMPGDEGYPTYLTSKIAGFFERAGVVETLDGKIGSITMLISVSPPGGDLTEPVTQSCLRIAGVFLFLDKELATRRFFPAINYRLSYSLYEKELLPSLINNFGKDYKGLKAFLLNILGEEEKLKEILEVVGYESLQDKDRLIMDIAELIKGRFLSQNSFTKDAFSTPKETIEKIGAIKEKYDEAYNLLKSEAPFFEIKKVYETF